MSKLRSLSTAFWSDPFIEDLSPSEKLLFIYLVTNEKTNMLGIYESSVKKMSFETGINKDIIEKALKGFERLGKLKYINNYVILVNYMKHQNFNTNMKKSAIDIYNNLPKELKPNDIVIDRSNPLEGFERLSKGYAILPKREVEVEVESKEERERELAVTPSVFSFKQKFLDLGVDKQILSDWLLVRKNKKATNTETAFNSLLKKMQESKLSIAECVKVSAENSWSGYDASWTDKNNNSNTKQNDFEKTRYIGENAAKLVEGLGF